MFPFVPPTMLAPMEGVTHPELRSILAERGGLGVVCTEFVRIGHGPVSPRALQRAVVKSPGTPLSVQVMGNDPLRLAEAAKVVATAGADVVDINLGCPVPRVVKKGVGAAMLRDPGLLFTVVRAMRKAVPGLLSAKIRAGFDDTTSLISNAKILEEAGVDFLVVHPRRRVDFFEGVADWRAISLVKEQLRVPVVGNGDIWYAADALRMIESTGCDAVMIGRPALRNPWIFEQIADLWAGRRPRQPTGQDLHAHLVEVATRLRRAFPSSKNGCVGKLKELVSYVARAVPDDRCFQRMILRLSTTEAILEHSATVLAPLSASELDLAAEGTLGLERSGRV